MGTLPIDSTANALIQQLIAAVAIKGCPAASPTDITESSESPAPVTSRGLIDNAGKA